FRCDLEDVIDEAHRRLQTAQAHLDQSLADSNAVAESLDGSLARTGGGVEQLHEQIRTLLDQADEARRALTEAVPAGHTITELRQLVLEATGLREELAQTRNETVAQCRSA